MLSNLSMDDNGMKNILIVVAAALALYLLVTYIKEHKHKQTDILDENHNSDNGNGGNGGNVNGGNGGNVNGGNVNGGNGGNGGNSGNGGNGSSETFDNYEGFYNHEDEAFGAHGKHEGFENKANEENEGNDDEGPSASMGVGNNDSHGQVSGDDGNDGANLPTECYPKEVLSSQDLLPNDANSKWAQTNPSGQGSFSGKNFLTAGFHVGVNTVGQSLRNANRQLRSDPPNPQVKVSPWMQTTIEPDVNRKAMEIGGN